MPGNNLIVQVQKGGFSRFRQIATQRTVDNVLQKRKMLRRKVVTAVGFLQDLDTSFSDRHVSPCGLIWCCLFRQVSSLGFVWQKSFRSTIGDGGMEGFPEIILISVGENAAGKIPGGIRD
ncbi:MAG: hypothetical protein ACYDHY_16035 [Acidiferrobacterales bacterium]